MEIWLKYGRTEVFADFGGERLQIFETQPVKADFTNTIESAADTISDSSPVEILVDYVSGVEGFSELVVTLISKLLDKRIDPRGVKVKVSGWRYGHQQVEEIITSELAQAVKRLAVEVSPLGRDSSSDGFILISPTIYWGGKITSPSKLCRSSVPVFTLSPAVGWGGAIVDLFAGEYREVERRASEVVENSSKLAISPDVDILVLGGPGYPTDHYLSTTIHLASALSDDLEGLAVIIPWECSGGLGPKDFIQSLTGETEGDSSPYASWVRIWRAISTKNKVCLVTSLPSTIVEKLLNAKQADTLDNALIYARRLKSREANIVVLKGSLGTRLCLEKPRYGNEGEDQHSEHS